jgi:hypothetical protein
MRVTTFLATLSTALVMTVPVSAQTDRRAARRGDADGHVQQWFEASGLKVGDPFPAVEILDAAGKPFSTRSLKGQYTVLVNGCLT